MYKSIFHERLSIAMKVREKKQVDLVNATGISKPQISEYCSGRYKPKQDKLYLIAQALQVNPVWLMGFDVDMDTKTIDVKKKIINRINVMTNDELIKLNTLIETVFDKGDDNT